MALSAKQKQDAFYEKAFDERVYRLLATTYHYTLCSIAKPYFRIASEYSLL
jgi:hypothetical protein